MKLKLSILFVWLGFAGIFSATAQTLKPVVFYLKNLPVQRIGEWSDKQIRTALEADGILVIDVDCSTYPTTSPELEEALVAFHKKIPSLLASYESETVKPDLETVFYVPEGYMLTRNIPVWNFEEHGADGTLERVMNIYNDYIVSHFDVAPVTSPDEMVVPGGKPIDWWLRMDIVHPSGHASKQVPLLLNFSSNSPRQVPFDPTGASDELIYRSIFPLGFLTTGYAWATADHCYNPLARGETYGYFDQYSLEDWNGLSAVRAYVRYLRSHATDYNLNDRIGVMGISKASYSAVRIADTKNAEGSEHFLFNSTPNTKEQPWPNVPSTVDVAYAAAGNGTRRIPQYVNADAVPMITSAGSKDQYNQWDVYPEVVKHMNDIDHIHLPLWMEELGHTYPGMGIDVATGEKRYVIFKRFFDHYLKPSGETEAAVFYVLPKEGATEVDANGYSRVLPADGVLPMAMLGLPVNAPITVRFLSEFSVENIGLGVTVSNKATGEKVEGTWSSSMQNTTFSFEPEEPMGSGEYRITVSGSLSNKAGKQVGADFIREFQVTKSASGEAVPVKTEKIFPSDDTYTAVSKNTSPKGAQETLRVRYSSMGDWRFDSYLKFDISGIESDKINAAKLYLVPSATLSNTLPVQFYTTSTEWTEEDLVSANRPTFAGNYFDAQSLDGTTSLVEVDVTRVLAEALERGEQYLSIALRIPNNENTENIYFHSKEAANEEFHPCLGIDRIIHVGAPTIKVERVYEQGETIELEVATEYQDEITNIDWFVNDMKIDGTSIDLPVGTHKIKAIITNSLTPGKDVIVRYVTVE